MATEVVLRLTGDASGLKKALDTVDRELAQVVQQTDRAQAALGQGLGRATQEATKRANQFSDAQRSALRAGRQSRANLQNFAFQMQDVVVQLEMGTDAARIFAQQGSQILGIFGPWATLAGAALAGMVPLIRAMGIFGDETEKAADSLQQLRDEADQLRFNVTTEEELNAMRELRKAREDYNKLVERYLNTDSLSMRQNLAEQANAQKEIVAAASETLEEYRQARAELADIKQQVEEQAKFWHDVLNPVDEIKWRVDQMEGGLQRLIDRTKDWAKEMYDVAKANLQINVPGLDGGMQRQFDSQAYGAGQQAARDLIQDGYTLPEDKPKGGGSGKSPAEKQREEMIKLMKAVDDAVASYEGLYDINKQMTDIWEGGITQGISGFTDALFDADKSFEDFAKNMLINIGKIITQTIIMNALLSAFGGTPGLPSGQIQTALQNVAGITPYAKGGVVQGATMFPMSSGMGVMGEAGPEAIMPLQTGADGRLGVAGPNIRINNYSGQEVQVTRSDDEVIEIAVGRARQASAQDFAESMASGHGTYAQAMEGSYNSRRKAF